jgi:anti-sigma-K factor RskA
VAHPSRENLVAYVLGALDPEEQRDVESHAPDCGRCSREFEALSPAVAVLGESVEQLEPPPELRERVLAIVHEEAGARQAPAAPPRERRGFRGFLLRPAVALATLAVVAAGVTGYLLNDNGGGGAGQTTVPVTAQSGIGGTLTVGANSSMLDLHGMQQLTGSAVYQVWVAKGSSLRPSSNFIPDPAGKATTSVDGHLTAETKVMVTREPHPGRTTPTPPILLSATVD